MTGVDKIVWIAYWRTRKVQAGKPWSMCWYPTQENTIPTDQRQWGSPVHEQLCEPSSARSVGGKWLDAWNFWCSDFVHSFLPNETCMYGRCASVKYRMSSTQHPMSKSGVHRCANSTLYLVALQWVACACLCPYHHYPHYKHVNKKVVAKVAKNCRLPRAIQGLQHDMQVWWSHLPCCSGKIGWSNCFEPTNQP